MGLELTILPTVVGNENACHDVLTIGQDYELFDKIKELYSKEGVRVPRSGVNTHFSRRTNGEYCYGKTTKNPYGDKLKSVLASELAHVFFMYPHEKLGWKNEAVYHYLHRCPKDLPVYLFWH